jgi:hypothetical protein
MARDGCRIFRTRLEGGVEGDASGRPGKRPTLFSWQDAAQRRSASRDRLGFKAAAVLRRTCGLKKAEAASSVSRALWLCQQRPTLERKNMDLGILAFAMKLLYHLFSRLSIGPAMDEASWRLFAGGKLAGSSALRLPILQRRTRRKKPWSCRRGKAYLRGFCGHLPRGFP